MRKFFIFTICIFTLLSVTILPNAKLVFAGSETIVTSRLEYFELDKPLSVDRDGDKVFIAQKNLIVIYHDQTYDKIEVVDGDISYIEKCGNHLLFLNGDKLYSLNLATYEISTALFSGVNSFSVNNLQFAINCDKMVEFFEVTDSENFLFSPLKPTYQNDFSVPILEKSNAIALAENLTFYYYAFSLVKDVDEGGRQGNTFDQMIDNLCQFCYTDNQLFFKTDKIIYSYTFENSTVTPIVDLSAHGISSEGGFCVDGNKILICDTQNDRVVEFDTLTLALTGFEISFTKIDLPQDFDLTFNSEPMYITVNEGDRLYDINIDKSIENGYFLFNGYHNQDNEEKYLLLKEIQNSFYLIAGDCFALVLKENYSPTPIALSGCDNVGFITNRANCYNYPMLDSHFLSFGVEKHEQVRIVCTLSFNEVDYSIVDKNGNLGFIPSSFILSEIYTPDEYHDYRTATTIKRPVPVFDSNNLTQEIDTLDKFSSIVIINEEQNCYYISYNQGKSFGYIAKSSVTTKGSYTNKNVIVIILVAISMTVTGIFLAFKYLYQSKKKL